MHSSFSPAYYKYSTNHTDGSFRDIKLLNAKFYFHISVFILLIISSQKLFVTSLYQPVGNEADFKKNFICLFWTVNIFYGSKFFFKSWNNIE